MLDLTISMTLVGVLGLVGVAYLVRLARRGRARSARVEAAGSSPLLGRPAMEMAYWTFVPLGRLLVRCGVTANAVTLVSVLLGMAAGVAIAFSHFGIGAGLSTLSAIGDALDGIVARESATSGDAGEMLDAVVDRYNEFFFLGGLAIHFRDDWFAFLLSLIALLGSFTVSYSTATAEALRVTPPRGAMRRAERAVYLTLGIALAPLAAYFWGHARIGHSGYSVADIPIVIVLFVVALVANVSGVRRVLRIDELARSAKPSRAPPSGPIKPESSPIFPTAAE